ncbi:unnamed protein product [Acanthosepion pharaonis]|uniref:Uncharacterized protein n=1 Tax=Acanthosepion pharaonis TaxID=158019 RepID=A0A812CX53_ACAPH|nr:unnamed protein product [Sepia pharaonis]
MSGVILPLYLLSSCLPMSRVILPFLYCLPMSRDSSLLSLMACLPFCPFNDRVILPLCVSFLLPSVSLVFNVGVILPSVSLVFLVPCDSSFCVSCLQCPCDSSPLYLLSSMSRVILPLCISLVFNVRVILPSVSIVFQYPDDSSPLYLLSSNVRVILPSVSLCLQCPVILPSLQCLVLPSVLNVVILPSVSLVFNVSCDSFPCLSCLRVPCDSSPLSSISRVLPLCISCLQYRVILPSISCLPMSRFILPFCLLSSISHYVILPLCISCLQCV